MIVTGITVTKFVTSLLVGVAIAHRTYVILTKEERKEFFEKHIKNTTL